MRLVLEMYAALSGGTARNGLLDGFKDHAASEHSISLLARGSPCQTEMKGSGAFEAPEGHGHVRRCSLERALHDDGCSVSNDVQKPEMNEHIRHLPAAVSQGLPVHKRSMYSHSTYDCLADSAIRLQKVLYGNFA